MKIAGSVPGVNFTRHEIRRPDGRAWEIKLTALPLGFLSQLEADLPDPRPPESFAREGGRILRDEDGRPLKTLDEKNPRYVAELDRVRSLRSYAILVQAMKGDDRVTFEANEDSLSRKTFLETVEIELRDAGIADSEIFVMVNKVHALNRGHVDRIEKAAEDFLPGTPLASDGQSPTTPAAQPVT
jgi:hypothetical protein